MKNKNKNHYSSQKTVSFSEIEDNMPNTMKIEL